MSKTVDPRDDVIEICAKLIQIDTTNPGDNSGPGELAAAEYAQSLLAEVGIDAEIFTTTAPHRAGLATLIPGEDNDRPPLLLTGHLDVVPAEADDWTHPPFSGHIDDKGLLWGRGAVDMKDMVAMELAIVRHWARTGYTPPRPIALLLTPDEEAGGRHGAHWIVKNRPELLHGATEAIGEVGGYSIDLPNGRRIYPIQTGEKGLAWITLRVPGTAGHGSLIHFDNPVQLLVEAVQQLTAETKPVILTDTMKTFVEAVSGIIGEPLDLADHNRLTEQVGSFARMLGAVVRTTVNPTMLEAGYKHNVVPSHAAAGLDVRFVPGTQEDVIKHIEDSLPPGTTTEYAGLDIALETSFDGQIVDAIISVLAEVDPDAVPVPYLVSGGTDGKAFSTLGVRYFGFSPLILDGLDFWSMFHAVDECVPLEGLRFGVNVLDEVLRRC